MLYAPVPLNVTIVGPPDLIPERERERDSLGGGVSRVVVGIARL